LSKFELAAFNDISNLVNLDLSTIVTSSIDMRFQKFLLDYYSSLPSEHALNFKQLSELKDDYKLHRI
jgi:hypothetical protein